MRPTQAFTLVRLLCILCCVTVDIAPPDSLRRWFAVMICQSTSPDVPEEIMSPAQWLCNAARGFDQVAPSCYCCLVPTGGMVSERLPKTAFRPASYTVVRCLCCCRRCLVPICGRAVRAVVGGGVCAALRRLATSPRTAGNERDSMPLVAYGAAADGVLTGGSTCDHRYICPMWVLCQPAVPLRLYGRPFVGGISSLSPNP